LVLLLFQFSCCFYSCICIYCFINIDYKVSNFECQMNKLKSITTPWLVNNPEQQPPSLLNQIDMSSRQLINQVHHPSDETLLPLHMRISTPLLMNVIKEELQKSQPPRNCLSPWNGSPISQLRPERRHSSPSLLRSTPLIKRLSSVGSATGNPRVSQPVLVPIPVEIHTPNHDMGFSRVRVWVSVGTRGVTTKTY
jgi:hypothetical protein